ncbi:HypC/HybG/HupF family hydrogenase formation chaperone [uncultured Megasphaera sp.]|nr:HypC/HybG/HupF family hydrogenase formation chaperone [uncultured Megasphaera sp.]
MDPGDYVMVHAGVAIAKITASDEDESDEILEDLL